MSKIRTAEEMIQDSHGDQFGLFERKDLVKIIKQAQKEAIEAFAERAEWQLEVETECYLNGDQTTFVSPQSIEDCKKDLFKQIDNEENI